ncbi:MAG TPA: hypothetical protein VFO55_14885 [Gemmatimonadaceae bacterium]|nr:hypothetical protein [Gemmatimonadaceae bacterium]
MRDEPLAVEQREAEEALKTSLQKACRMDVSRADTGELIRVEEMLAIATDAAKKAISIRRKRRQERRELADAALEPGPQRTFTGADGAEWSVRAVQPLGVGPGNHSRLPDAFRSGWLAFECDGRKRRLSPIPADWDQLGDEELEELCADAEEASVRRRDERPG